MYVIQRSVVFMVNQDIADEVRLTTAGVNVVCTQAPSIIVSADQNQKGDLIVAVSNVNFERFCEYGIANNRNRIYGATVERLKNGILSDLTLSDEDRMVSAFIRCYPDLLETGSSSLDTWAFKLLAGGSGISLGAFRNFVAETVLAAVHAGGEYWPGASANVKLYKLEPWSLVY